MTSNQHARLAKAYLEELCSCIDQRRPLPARRRDQWLAAIPASLAIGLSFTGGACGGSTDETNKPPAEVCNDKVDNDGDGQIDCGDVDCQGSPSCSGAEYGGPFEAGADVSETGSDEHAAEVCNDNIDNDGDGKIDCGDLVCMGVYPCTGPEYGAPF